MKRDLYATVTTRIVAELEQGATRWTKSWSATPGANTPCQRREQPALLWLQRCAVVDVHYGG